LNKLDKAGGEVHPLVSSSLDNTKKTLNYTMGSSYLQ